MPPEDRLVNRSLLVGLVLGSAITLVAMNAIEARRAVAVTAVAPDAAKAGETRTYDNALSPIKDPKPLLGDFPHFVEPVIETRRFEAPRLVDDLDADLDVRAW